MNLVIVESPTKAKTISKFLDKNYRVLSSFGHIRDLPKAKLGIDEEKDFSPEYIIPVKARKNLSLLKKEAKKADTIILATDEDREGEAIAWHITKALSLPLKPGKKTSPELKRIVFHEITQDAILKALKEPRGIDLRLVDAQQARRVLDRLVGYKLSPFLWKKITWGLSAGRVQSVAVRLICEREQEIKSFKPQEFWKIASELKPAASQTDLKSSQPTFWADLAKIERKPVKKFDIKSKNEAESIKQDLKKAVYSILGISKKEALKHPLPPYTTSTLQQDAAIRLRFSSKKTMYLAQKLYEGIKLGKGNPVGLITYMRTDSLNLSEGFLSETQNYLKEKFTEKDSSAPRRFKTKTKGAQEAHEAIRPTSIYNDPCAIEPYLSKDEAKLYRLIWQRALASQMSPAKIDLTKVIVEAKNNKNYQLEAKGEIIKFLGFLAVYAYKSKEKILPPLQEQQSLTLSQVIAEQKFTQPPARYSEAMLIKTLEKYGIGRPSTYAPIISTIQARGYVEKNDQRRFEPTEVGLVVNNLLVKHFPKIVDYDFTALMEKELDEIAEGKKEWVPVIREFYQPFLENLKKSYQKAKSQDGKKIGKKCPKCDGELIERFSRFGKFYACSNFPKCKYTESGNGETKKPKKTDKKCPHCGGTLLERIGRYGQFWGCENYPKCKYIENSRQKTGISCPRCSSGEIVQKRTKKKRVFYGCSNYPDCKFALWNKPLNEKCPDCGALMTQNAKGKKICSAGKLCSSQNK